MKNIFKSLMLTAALAFGSAAFADGTSYLYWMLSDTPANTPVEWTYAQVKVVGASDAESAESSVYLTSALNEGVTKFGKESNGGYDYISRTLAMIGSEYLSDSYKFIVELYGDGSDPLAYSAAINGGSILASSSAMGVTGSNTFGSVHVPEPTSGLLALLGFGMLALRRRKI